MIVLDLLVSWLAFVKICVSNGIVAYTRDLSTAVRTLANRSSSTRVGVFCEI